ncbi:MAG: DUF5667 domain-containing protein [bacterium]|nr:DUF5667 domain-containing protein [bacterium]
MEEQDLIRYIKKIHQDNPREAWLFTVKEELFSRMRKNPVVSKNSAYSVLALFRSLAKPQIVMAGLLLALFVGGIGMVLGAGMSEISPSSALYPIKLAKERVKEALVFTEEQKADYGLAVAQERIQELTLLSREATIEAHSERQTALIAQTLQRYTKALGDSSFAVKQMQASGNEDLAREKAEKLDETARAYTVLLSTFDTASSSLPIFEDAKAVSMEAQSTAEEILIPESASSVSSGSSQTFQEDSPSSSDILSADSSHESAEDSSAQTPTPFPDEPTGTRTSILPNIVE